MWLQMYTYIFCTQWTIFVFFPLSGWLTAYKAITNSFKIGLGTNLRLKSIRWDSGRHNVCKRYIVIGPGVKQTERTIFLHISMGLKL